MQYGIRINAAIEAATAKYAKESPSPVISFIAAIRLPAPRIKSERRAIKLTLAVFFLRIKRNSTNKNAQITETAKRGMYANLSSKIKVSAPCTIFNFN